MAMEISKSFVVKAPAGDVWTFLTDPVRVARCLPGAAITGQVDDRTHAGTITVKVGPVAASYKGTMRFERLDAAARTAEIVAGGQDVRGKGGADMRMISTLVERAPDETEVAITSQVNVMGILAQFGRGMIQDVSDRMFDTFVAAARKELEKPAGTPGARGRAPRDGAGRRAVAWLGSCRPCGRPQRAVVDRRHRHSHRADLVLVEVERCQLPTLNSQLPSRTDRTSGVKSRITR
jgi:carbon monoxide dehydrogenase subunit G